jgi:ribosomal protein S18 acetylase RimI-like enzyme
VALRARSYLVGAGGLHPSPVASGGLAVPVIRPFATDDLASMYRICLLTGDAGRDASQLYRDPDLLAHIYCGPYPGADPTLTLVVVDDDAVVGYLVGTADTTTFDAWAEQQWWPGLRARYPLAPDDGTADHRLVEHIHHPPVVVPPPGHPAALHIDLLPRAQGQGWGRRLIEGFAGLLRERGVPGLHLEIDPRNTAAAAFYARLGFVPDPEGRLLLAVSPRR